MKCKQCGMENKDGAFLCSACGYVFNDAEDMFSENKKTINAEASHKQSQIEEIKRRRDQKKKRKKIKKLILLVIAVLVVVGAVAASFYVSGKKDKEISDNSLKPAENISTPVPELTEQPEEPITAEEEAEQLQSEEQLPVVEEAEQAVISEEQTEQAEQPKEATKKQNASKKTEEGAPAVQKAEPKKTKAPAKTSSATQQTKKAGITSTLVDVVKTVSDENGSFIVASTNGKTVYIQGAAAENNSYAIISAEDTGIKVDNVPVYNATELKTVPASEFIMPLSSFKRLTEDDIAGLSADELRLARNEIYARHGRTFKDNTLNEYFKAKSWYKVNSAYNYKNDVLNVNETENINAHFLLAAERKLLGE